MKHDTALARYLQRHIEPELPAPPDLRTAWQYALVIPAYRESPRLLQSLTRSLEDAGGGLTILVLNRPQGDPDTGANDALRTAVSSLPAKDDNLYRLDGAGDLYCHDLEREAGPTPSRQGVGLARKTGCDLALLWWASGCIDSDWMGCTDGDATLPRDYFSRLQHLPPGVGAAVFPFEHLPGEDEQCNSATALYELRLHHYVLGLQYAGSPYAYHSLGSATAVRFGAYARVRGFPRRSGAEDFYLLNKVSKLGPLARLEGEAIGLQSRPSSRVPFGTGPAVAEIAAAGPLKGQRLFYHPRSFEALRAVLQTLPQRRDPEHRGDELLLQAGLVADSARFCEHLLQDLGLEQALAHCRRQARTGEQFLRQFHQWFDAFRTLKYLHALRDNLWPAQSLLALQGLEPQIWPGSPALDVAALRAGIRDHWHWLSAAGS